MHSHPTRREGPRGPKLPNLWHPGDTTMSAGLNAMVAHAMQVFGTSGRLMQHLRCGADSAAPMPTCLTLHVRPQATARH